MLLRSKTWIYKRYYKQVKGRKWNFFEGDKTLLCMGKIPIKRFAKVRKDVRVYNIDDKEYWDKREYMNARDSIYNSYDLTYLFRDQKGICVFCEKGISQEDVQTYNIHKHHLKPKSVGGKDEKSNLKLLHRDCHREVHSKLSRKEMASYVDSAIDYIQLLRPV